MIEYPDPRTISESIDMFAFRESLPPQQYPRDINTNITPIRPVHVSIVEPRYGEISLEARSSTTMIKAPITKAVIVSFIFVTQSL